MATGQIYTDKAAIMEALGQVKGVIGEMATNISTLNKMKEDLLTQFKGDAASGYDQVAVDLDQRLRAYEQSIANLDRSTNNAADMIGAADQDVARMFRGLL
ncbi:WXG100 family type VII secretion target [Nocardia sp. NPDC058499]|uniref:WXG100 family type VII secretion target n=1 Tax=Nocardia sp. NPDC058499 TaxID=3346530 RepID=UPI00365F2FBA